jgi:hypothetical protein
MDSRSPEMKDSVSRKNSSKAPSPLIQNNKIMHSKILAVSQSSAELQGGLIEVYRREVLTQKTRTVRLLGIKSDAKIIQTLLGYEVQAKHKRINCPDLVTARYLKLFSTLGCHSIRIPYDPTATARLIPLMEQAIQRVKDTIAEIFPRNSNHQQYVLQKICAIIRNELRNVS